MADVLPHDIKPELRKELEGTPELAQMERENARHLDAVYPEPTQTEIINLYDEMRSEWHEYQERVREERAIRYLQDDTPEKLKRKLQYGRRIHSRLSHNEIMRVVAMATRNRPRVHIPAAGKTEKARKRATLQERWCDQLLPYIERRAKRPIWRTGADYQAGDGFGAFMVYMSDAYDRVADQLERQQIIDVDGTEREETDKEFMDRTEELLQRAGPPFGVRVIDPLSLYVREDEEGPYRAIVWERKVREQQYSALIERIGVEEFEKRGLPPVGTGGRPEYSHNSEHEDSIADYVDCLQYWDRRWYAYIIDGRLVEGPVEHGLPGVPIFTIEGMTTGSPNLAERLQGITWGMGDLETALNDLLTLEHDNATTYGRPRVAIQTPPDGNLLKDRNDQPRVLDFDQPGVVQLNPGQQIVDAFAGFRPQTTTHIQEMLLRLWQRSGLNPIAQGESPGADPAGYTVNSLQGAAQANYEILLDNIARAWAGVCDFIRMMIRDTIRDRVYLSVPMQDTTKGGTEWLGLGPDDIDETPTEVIIDPLSDANRMQLFKMWQEANANGYAPRRVVQEALPGGDDPEAWDNEIVLESAEQQLFPMAIEEAINTIRMRQAADDPQMVQQQQPMPQEQGGRPSMPTVGAEAAAASQGGSVAGQDNGYAPPPGTMTDQVGGSNV